MIVWKPGQGVIMREVWRNKVYSVVPLRVVTDESSSSALYLPPKTRSLWPHTQEGVTIRIPVDDWVLDGGPYEGGDVLSFVQPGLGYTVTAVWDTDHVFDHWKIDLVEPVRRTSLGFDYMDQLLDIIVNPDRTIWHWKDEDELFEAQARGLFTARQVKDLYQQGESALHTLQSYTPPFNSNWEDWIPDPAWKVPFTFPEGWEII